MLLSALKGLIGVLTPREVLTFAGKLKNPPGTDVDKLAEQVLEKIGLKEVADSKIGTLFSRGLSGGQKRRCTIGVELMSTPRIMCLDEVSLKTITARVTRHSQRLD